jgi:hypothetical protein
MTNYSFKAKKPTRTFLWFLGDDIYRTTLETFRALWSRGSMSGSWRYEARGGEAGVYPTMEEWAAIHPDGACGTPCRHCARAGYDAKTGKSKGPTSEILTRGLVQPMRRVR